MDPEFQIIIVPDSPKVAAVNPNYFSPSHKREPAASEPVALEPSKSVDAIPPWPEPSVVEMATARLDGDDAADGSSEDPVDAAIISMAQKICTNSARLLPRMAAYPQVMPRRSSAVTNEMIQRYSELFRSVCSQIDSQGSPWDDERIQIISACEMIRPEELGYHDSLTLVRAVLHNYMMADGDGADEYHSMIETMYTVTPYYVKNILFPDPQPGCCAIA